MVVKFVHIILFEFVYILVPAGTTNITKQFSMHLDSALTWNVIYMWSENDGTLLACQPTTWSRAHWFTKVKSGTFSRVLILNVGLLPKLQKFKCGLVQYASRSSPRGFILEDPHIMWCVFASITTKVEICSFAVKTNRSLNKLGRASSSAAMYVDTKTKLSLLRHTFYTLTVTISSYKNIGIREQQRSGVA